MKMSLPWGTENRAVLSRQVHPCSQSPMTGSKRECDSRERPSTGVRECEGVGVCQIAGDRMGDQQCLLSFVIVSL